MGFGSILGAVGGDILGSVVSGVFNARQADKNRDFQAAMSGTAHQREVKDLKAAGLNPILSANLGGSSSPAGATASMAPSSPGSTATTARLATAQMEQIKSATALNVANARQVAVNTALDEKYGPSERLGRGDAWKVHSARMISDRVSQDRGKGGGAIQRGAEKLSNWGREHGLPW